jgi:hypothetical protein
MEQGSKRLKVEEILYEGTRGIEILKLLLFYGFDHMKDILDFLEENHWLSKWALGKLYLRSFAHTSVQYDLNSLYTLFQPSSFPSPSLLSIHKFIHCYTLNMLNRSSLSDNTSIVLQ